MLSIRRIAALLLAAATGFAGLVYEIVWERYLAILLGSHAEARCAVLAIFLGGLAAGYLLFGRLSRLLAGKERAGEVLLRTYGLVEIGIGVIGLLFPLLFAAVRRLSVAIPHLGESGNFAVDVLLTTLLIGPPTLLMGATIPLLTQALTRDEGEATRTHALVYGVNTVGAFCGALAAGYLLVPRHGLVGTAQAMGTVNLLAGLAYICLSIRAPGGVRFGSVQARSGKTHRAILGVAFLCGFAAMTLQVVVMRLGGLSFGSSPFTFTTVVATFVLSIGVGSLAVSLLGSRCPRWSLPALLWVGVVLLLVMYRLAEAGPQAGYRLRILFQNHDAAFAAHEAGVFLAVALFTAPIALISGAALPLLFDLLRRERERLGDVAGRLFCWNTLGSLGGALLGGYALLFILDLHHVFRLAVAALLVAAVLLSSRVLVGASKNVALAPALPAMLLLVLAGPWKPEALSPGLLSTRQPLPESSGDREAFLESVWKNREVLFHDDDPTSTVLVTRYGDTESLGIVTNGKIDGNTSGDYSTMSLLGLLPAVLVEEPRRAFVVGWGTGISASELAGLESVQQVTVAEISSGVIRARAFFDPYNSNASRNPKIEIVRCDAYRTLTRSAGKWDVIVSEPSNPWMAGVEMLYSREFLQAARDRLNEGGLFVQWLHGYETDDRTIDLIVRTYASVFEDFSVWFTSAGDYALVGLQSPDRGPRLGGIVDRWAVLQRRFGEAGIDTLPALLAHEVVPFGTFRDTGDQGPLHTLLRPRLNYRAVRGHFQGKRGFLPFSGWGRAAAVGQERSLLRQYLHDYLHDRISMEAWDEIATTLCSARRPECGAMLAFWVAQGGGTRGLEEKAGQVVTRNGALTTSDLLVASLLFDGPRNGDPPQVDVSGGERVIELYHALYNHAVPFSPEVLRRTLSQCVPERGRTARACAELGAKVSRLVEQGQYDFASRSAPVKLTLDPATGVEEARFTR